jgi:uncharacterized protein (DUF1810 family)
LKIDDVTKWTLQCNENKEPGMIKGNNAIDRDDPFELNRFISAQEGIYDRVLAELRSGRKRTHWMWFIFPQIDGLGHSATTRRYAIKSMEEVRQYLNHPVLGPRLVECAEAVLAIEGRSISEIFGYPDDLKLESSMTLFACVADPRSVFVRILDKYFQGERDVRTLHLVENLKENR